MSTLEYVIVALVVGTLAVVLWQVISIRRLAGLLDRVRDSQCEQEYRACKRECEKLVQRRSTVESPFDVLDDAIGQVGWDPGWDPCERERFKAQIACYGIPGSDEPDPAARELAARLAPFVSGTHRELFAGPTTTRPEGHLVVFSLRDLPDDVVDATADHVARRPEGGFATVLIEFIGGAPLRVPADSMAFNQRSARVNASALGIWMDAALDSEHVTWARTFATLIAPVATEAEYVNYMTDDTPVDRVRATYGDNYDRLARIKSQYDPQNVFRVNQNIAPA